MKRLLLFLMCTSCATTRVYLKPNASPIKHIAVVGWGPNVDMGQVVAEVGADLVRQRKNYLVHKAASTQSSWSGFCEDLQGVIELRVLNTAPLTMSGELYDCHDGSLLWRAERRSGNPPKDLQQLTEAYVKRLGSIAGPYAAPVFVLLKPLLETLPNPPPPTEQELLEIIELGAM